MLSPPLTCRCSMILTPSQFLIVRKIRTTIVSPQISPSMSFSASTMERESVLHGINSQQSFEALPLKPNGQIKNTGAPDRIPSDPAISRHESPCGVRRRSLPKLDNLARSRYRRQADLRLLAIWNPRTTTFIRLAPSPQPPRRRPAPGDQNEWVNSGSKRAMVGPQIKRQQAPGSSKHTPQGSRRCPWNHRARPGLAPPPPCRASASAAHGQRRRPAAMSHTCAAMETKPPHEEDPTGYAIPARCR